MGYNQLMADLKRPRYQIHLADLLVFVFLNSIGMLLFIPGLDLADPWPEVFIVDITILGITVIGGLMGVRRSNEKSFTGWKRLLTIFAANLIVAAGPLLITYLIIPSCVYPRSASNQNMATSGCKAYAEAQEIYHRTDHNGDGVLEFAQSLNDLYETSPGAGNLNLLDKSFVLADDKTGKVIPKNGYCFRLLKAQGNYANDGKKDYVVDGHMTAGYALLAYPAKYSITGYLTFIINNSGTIYEKDLGKDTRAWTQKCSEFNPDSTWVVSE